MSASRVVLLLAATASAATWACVDQGQTTGSVMPVGEGKTDLVPSTSEPDSGPTSSRPQEDARPAVPTRAPLPPFPETLPLHQPQDVPIAGDRNLRVAHASGAQLGAIIYLPGMCGNPKGADPWIDLATAHATVITVRGNVKCPDRPGYKWPHDPAEIQPRIDAALAHVAELRAGHLNTEVVTLIGYSQGAHRGEKLAATYPDRYRAVVLGGPPTAPDPELLARTPSVAIVGGELEETTHMVEGFQKLQKAGISARFFVLPGAHHGSYGPEGRRVMKEVLDFSFAPEVAPRHVRSETPASH